MRRCAVHGVFAAVVRHGDDDAGAIFIKVSRLDGSCQLFAPAPAGFDGASEDRRWRLDHVTGLETESAADARLAREEKFDGDHWVIEVEDRTGRHFLDGQLMD